ncbi:MAG: hypothetical protein LBV13_00105 [Methanomassiliicoccaceae archaeon]|jgi:hypothetical protein|nr:hypothetical protein [Methanomassiliicoccaceae archaeon]
MTSIIKVKMNTCEKTHVITAEMNEEGSVDVHIDSDCEKIQDFGKKLKGLTVTDVTDFYKSKLNDPEIRGAIGFVCLVTNAVVHAVWMEYEMLSERHAKKAKHNSVIYDEKWTGGET